MLPGPSVVTGLIKGLHVPQVLLCDIIDWLGVVTTEDINGFQGP